MFAYIPSHLFTHICIWHNSLYSLSPSILWIPADCSLTTPTHFYTESQPAISINSNAARTPPPALSYNNHLPLPYKTWWLASLAPNPGPNWFQNCHPHLQGSFIGSTSIPPGINLSIHTITPTAIQWSVSLNHPSYKSHNRSACFFLLISCHLELHPPLC